MSPATYSADPSLAGKLRRRYARLTCRRPVRLQLARPVISFTFDDAPASAAAAGAILERHDARGTYYLCTDLFDQDGHMGRYANAAEVADLAQRGHEIACHTSGHIDCHRADAATLVDDSARNVAALAALGGQARHFAYPFGEVSPRAKSVLSDRYASLRGVQSGLVLNGADLNQLPAVGIEGPHGEARARRWIAAAALRKGWLILFTHDVRDKPSSWGCTPEALDRLAAYARESGCDIRTVGQVLGR